MSTTLEDIEDMPPVEAMMAAKYLSAAELAGETETVTIRRIQRGKDTFDGGRKDLVNVIGITRVDGTSAEMLWNKTNVAAARVLLGDDNTKWIGKRVTLCADNDRLRGEVVLAIRICGSPDAPPGRTKAFDQAWSHPDGRMNGGRGKSSLVSRLKTIISRQRAKAAQKQPTPEQQQRAEDLGKPVLDPPPREPGEDG